MTDQKRNLSGKALEQYKKKLILTDVQKDILVGCLLGDATMGLRNGKPLYSIKFEQSAQREQYISHLYKEFQEFCGSPAQKRWIDKKQTRQAIWFRTYRHAAFIFYFNMFYEIDTDSDTGKLVSKKIVPLNISKFLNARVLAYWFMDDGTFIRSSDQRINSPSGGSPGTKYFKKNLLPQLYLSTQGFKKHECERLCKALHSSLNIQANVHKDKDKWRIYIVQKSAVLFRQLVSPYILDDFKYKLS